MLCYHGITVIFLPLPREYRRNFPIYRGITAFPITVSLSSSNPPGTSHRVTSEPLKKEKPYHSGSSPAIQSPKQQAGLYKSCIEL